MRVVLDTGILIAALITTDTPPALIYQAWRKKRFELVTSEWQLDEFRRVSRYSKLRRFLKPVEAGNLVNGLQRQATVLDVSDVYPLAVTAISQVTSVFRLAIEEAQVESHHH